MKRSTCPPFLRCRQTHETLRPYHTEALTDQAAEGSMFRVLTKYLPLKEFMSITKALVEAEGGRVWASSEGLGKGTTITVVLPLAV